MKQKTLQPYLIESASKECQWFRRKLKQDNLSQNTIESYCWTLNNFLSKYNNKVSIDTLLAYKAMMIETCAPESVNCRIHGINRYLKEKNYDFRLKQVRIEPKQFVETISLQDYKYLKSKLKKDDPMLYLIVTGMATSGTRISEILTLKVEHVYDGMLSFYGKGTKYRTIFLQDRFVKDCMAYIEANNITDGYIFLQENGNPMDAPRVRLRLKRVAANYHIDKRVMHPHSFRHLFGKQYMSNGGDLVTLASIMGHSSIETTKIYLLVSLAEARAEFKRVVRW